MYRGGTWTIIEVWSVGVQIAWSVRDVRYLGKCFILDMQQFWRVWFPAGTNGQFIIIFFAVERRIFKCPEDLLWRHFWNNGCSNTIIEIRVRVSEIIDGRGDLALRGVGRSRGLHGCFRYHGLRKNNSLGNYRYERPTQIIVYANVTYVRIEKRRWGDDVIVGKNEIRSGYRFRLAQFGFRRAISD